jgi:ubiquinone/menaquinone biosynthesis C-methylase UbiE
MGDLPEINSYWQDNIPQIWYSNKEPLSLAWFNELSAKRYEVYYPYLKDYAEFYDHSGEEVLEIGVGPGTDLVEFHNGGAMVSGIDLGQNQIDLTKLNFKSRSLPIPNLNVGNAEDLDFEAEKFDYVYSFGVLHHTPNTQNAIDEIFRVLKSDGHATIMLYSRGWKHYLKRCFVQGIIRGKWFKYKSWQGVYNYASEVNGDSPLTQVFTKKQVRNLFANFNQVEIYKLRMGEFFEYAPYGTYKFWKFISHTAEFLNLQSVLGENYIIKAYKAPAKDKNRLIDVLFKHY